jgi:hypothetical protein
MDLLVLLLIFALLGYLFGISRIGKNADQTTEKVALASKKWVDRLGDQWNHLFHRGGLKERFLNFVMESDSAEFSNDFREWLESLSNAELNEFVMALANYSQGLGYDLSALLNGELDQDPRMRQVFVEAISVYSQAYRKAREARKKSGVSVDEEKADAKNNDKKPLAEKAPSRRQKTNGNDTVEAASTD